MNALLPPRLLVCSGPAGCWPGPAPLPAMSAFSRSAPAERDAAGGGPPRVLAIPALAPARCKRGSSPPSPPRPATLARSTGASRARSGLSGQGFGFKLPASMSTSSNFSSCSGTEAPGGGGKRGSTTWTRCRGNGAKILQGQRLWETAGHNLLEELLHQDRKQLGEHPARRAGRWSAGAGSMSVWRAGGSGKSARRPCRNSAGLVLISIRRSVPASRPSAQACGVRPGSGGCSRGRGAAHRPPPP